MCLPRFISILVLIFLKLKHYTTCPAVYAKLRVLSRCQADTTLSERPGYNPTRNHKSLQWQSIDSPVEAVGKVSKTQAVLFFTRFNRTAV
jgi:hypothetical protein